MKVLMLPHISEFNKEESGIRRVVEAYFRYLPKYGIELVNPKADSFDLIASHAASHPTPNVLHCHGLYFSADYPAAAWEKAVNRDVIHAARYATQITVPSAWVAEIFQRDMRINPHVIGHGIEWERWQGESDHGNYVLWNKNRTGDVCSAEPLGKLAKAFPDVRFVSTFPPPEICGNIETVGVLKHEKMARLVKRAAVYFSSTKETFGIGVLEALAAGTPVLGFAYGGNVDLVKHGVTGYLAQPGNYEDLYAGLAYCFQYRDQLSANAREDARRFTWDHAAETISHIYDLALADSIEPASVSVIIPSFNYGDKVGRAIKSAASQSFPVKEIIVVDDGSPDDGLTARVVEEYAKKDQRIKYYRKENGGVATARNYGIRLSTSKYVCCLDADDAIDYTFIEVCARALEEDRSLGAAYTGLMTIKPDGSMGLSQWPGEYDYDRMLVKQNQIPTCCVFRRSTWERLGGYNQKYAPGGCGTEDAEFWLRMGAYGMGAKKVTNNGLFLYSFGSGGTSKKGYQEVDWTGGHPWVKDGMHPFASLSKPKHFSHPVRQYDEPTVSVIIPVGPKHAKDVINALDSLESQTLRKWEAILVDDTGDPKSLSENEELNRAYPYIRWVVPETHGAGAARNAGARAARAPFLVFLDADDWLYPEALEKMVDAWTFDPGIIYTDYVGKAVIDHQEANRLKNAGKLRNYDTKTNEAVIASRANDYDYQRAIVQPDPSMYIWCLITCLIPKEWHFEIGGFDETMSSWEDWDYWIRLAKAGKCFIHLREELVVYRFYTGDRRERGLHDAQKLIKYLLEKYKDLTIMACGCRGNQPKQNPARNLIRQTSGPSSPEGNGIMENDEQYVMARYEHPNLGQHIVIGGATGKNYGRRGGGDSFLVHRADIAVQPTIFVVVEQQPTAPVSQVVQQAPPPPPQAPVAQVVKVRDEDGEVREVPYVAKEELTPEQIELQKIPGITSEIARELNAIGINSVDDILDAGESALKRVKGIGPSRADSIMVSANKIKNGEQVSVKRQGKR